MTLSASIDEHMLTQYRMLLDAEDAAFDELEHAYEDGDRDHFEADLVAWQSALDRRLAFLSKLGVEVPAPV